MYRRATCLAPGRSGVLGPDLRDTTDRTCLVSHTLTEAEWSAIDAPVCGNLNFDLRCWDGRSFGFGVFDILAVLDVVSWVHHSIPARSKRTSARSNAHHHHIPVQSRNIGPRAPRWLMVSGDPRVQERAVIQYSRPRRRKNSSRSTLMVGCDDELLSGHTISLWISCSPYLTVVLYIYCNVKGIYRVLAVIKSSRNVECQLDL